MKISRNWLNQWILWTHSTSDIAERLTLSGLDVKGIKVAGPNIDKKRVLIGKITNVSLHPQRNDLKICTVDVGKTRKLMIVCAAKNVVKNLKIPVALVQAQLPNGHVVKKKNINGVPSNGMICSSNELGLSDQSSNRLLMELDPSAPVGQSLSNYLELDEQIIDIELTPNRGDCLGMYGIAREISVLMDYQFSALRVKRIKPVNNAGLDILLEAPEACPRYVGRAISNVNVLARTPDWIVERLRRNDIRSIDSIVDITNYVMLETGQPIHAFDLNKIQEKIVVRMAWKREKLVLLGGQEIELTPEHLVIADSHEAISLAGIIGGKITSISYNTVNIYLESAFFYPSIIMGKASQFGIMHTNSSHRFERGVDSRLQVYAIERATELILSISGGEPGPTKYAIRKNFLPKRKPINFNLNQIENTIGFQVPKYLIEKFFIRLGMKVKLSTENNWQVTAPSWRFDIIGQHDLIEEVGRYYGLNQVPIKIPKHEVQLKKHEEFKIVEKKIKQTMIRLGYFEAISYSCVDPNIQNQFIGDTKSIVGISNPISSNMSVMRASILPGLLEAVKINLNRNEHAVRLFEIGSIFCKDSKIGLYKEIQKMAAIVTGLSLPKQWSFQERNVDFFDLKGDLEEVFFTLGEMNFNQLKFQSIENPVLDPSQSADIIWNNQSIGYIGNLNPVIKKSFGVKQKIYLFEINLTNLHALDVLTFRKISKFPSIKRDISILVNQSVQSQQIIKLIRAHSGDWLTRLELFDIYQGKQVEKYKKSVAFRLTFQSRSTNLISSDIDRIINHIINVLVSEFKATLRS